MYGLIKRVGRWRTVNVARARNKRLPRSGCATQWVRLWLIMVSDGFPEGFTQSVLQHTEKQPCVHFADANIAGKGIEVRHAIGGVLDGCFNPSRSDVAPVEVNKDFRIEIRAVAYGFLTDDGQRECKGVEAEAAHAVFDVAWPSIQHIPKIDSFSSVKSCFGYVIAVL